ncbi:protocatechuate 4,5-dioxygenase subunit alpha [Novosphingobium sp. SG919]|uniref:protocatechuate 4,5-dioxygenase subunit alpha n=1 Tax=unclassified Novosphingobium TaxID=2644732 RepID=UPI0017AEB85E|nr:protocatechuate 4,5-dioxygenase alpha chain [Novosphingobium sp. SG720]NMN06931.1 protocatechuate 4,5-dioxygenase alpha chain [Novosphingobium sp. SG919]NMN89482.1 protocatechuate 4,5-dioxygenase alpha chain [Novosphingobium sp. SG916]
MSIDKGAPDSKPRDIHEYLAEFDDIPGTRVYTAARARKGYHINQFAMSLMKAENRARFKADERAYLDEWKISEEAKQALLARDYNTLLDMGGNVYFLSKLFSSDGLPFAEAVSTMTDMTWPEYRQMMLDGGRSPEGNRSIKENLAAAARAQETGKDN